MLRKDFEADQVRIELTAGPIGSDEPSGYDQAEHSRPHLGCTGRVGLRGQELEGFERGDGLHAAAWQQSSLRSSAAIVRTRATRTTFRVSPQQMIKNVKFVELPGGPHGVLWTHADRINSELVSFLA